jgi:very-short-patch-repair endonuclease
MTPELFALAERQHGVVSRTQIEALGVSQASFRVLRRRNTLIEVTRGVYRVAGAPSNWNQNVMAAWLSARRWDRVIAIGRETAAAICEFRGFERSGKPVLVVPRGQGDTCGSGALVTCTDLRTQDVVRLDPSGITATSKNRTVFDLCLRQPTAARLDRFLDRALLDGHTTVPELWELVLHTQGRGKRGIVRTRGALEARSGDYVPLESELEHLAVEALAMAGITDAIRQHPLPGAPFGRVDLAFLDAKLVIELDGRQHQVASARRADYERDVAAARMGWQVVRFDWAQIKFAPQQFAAAVADILRTRRAQLEMAK